MQSRCSFPALVWILLSESTFWNCLLQNTSVQLAVRIPAQLEDLLLVSSATQHIHCKHKQNTMVLNTGHILQSFFFLSGTCIEFLSFDIFLFSSADFRTMLGCASHKFGRIGNADVTITA
jgi:hypothetical protein